MLAQAWMQGIMHKERPAAVAGQGPLGDPGQLLLQRHLALCAVGLLTHRAEIFDFGAWPGHDIAVTTKEKRGQS